LEGDWRDEFAIVYDAAAARGLNPRECDDLEIWVLAAALGANRADDSDPLVDEEGLTWNERRAIALARGDPEPQWADMPMTPKERADAEALMRNAPQGLLPPAVSPPA
jgi:hypothetical protein